MPDRLIIESSIGETRSALLAGDVAIEFHIEPDDNPDREGAICRARVTEAQPRSDSYFLDLGDNQRGILKSRHRLTNSTISEGTSLLVQLRAEPAAEDPGKAWPVTEKICLPGRYCMIQQQADGPQIAHRRRDDVPAAVRETESQFLWRRLNSLQAAGEPGELVPAPDLITRLLRDAPDGVEILISDHDAFRAVRQMARHWPDVIEAIECWTDPDPPFAALGLEEQLDSALSGEFALKCGGWISMERTRAMLTIDVNAAGAAAGHGGGSPAEVVNGQAMETVLAQLRLQNIGGLIAVDLLDMGRAARERLIDDVKARTAADPCQIDVGGIAPFQVLLLSRARRGRSLPGLLLERAGPRLLPTAVARALLRRAVSEARQTNRPGRLVITAGPAVHRQLEARKDWLEHLTRLTGRQVDLRRSGLDQSEESFIEHL